MGFFDRFRRTPRSFDDLAKPWDERTSIHDFLRDAAGADGMLPADLELPDRPEPAGGLRWAPGALDGVMTHHAAPPDGEARANALAGLIARARGWGGGTGVVRPQRWRASASVPSSLVPCTRAR